MVDLNQILVFDFANNTGRDYLIALGIFVFVLLVLKLFKVFILNRLKSLAKKTKNDFDDAVIEFIEQIQWPFLIFMAFYVATKSLVFSRKIHQIFDYMMIIFTVFYAVKGFNKIIDYITKKEIKKREKLEEGDTPLIEVLSNILKGMV
jgi:large-conductance mechanosensitive channel